MSAFMPCVLSMCESVSKEVCRQIVSQLLSPGPRSWECLQPVIKSLFEAPLSLARNFPQFQQFGL